MRKERSRQRQTETDRQTGRQTDRQADRQTDRQADRQTGRQTGRQTDRREVNQLVLQCEPSLLSLQGPNKQQEELLVQNQLVEGLQVRHHLLAVGNWQGIQDWVIGTGTGEQEPHCEGTEVSVREILVV